LIGLNADVFALHTSFNAAASPEERPTLTRIRAVTPAAPPHARLAADSILWAPLVVVAATAFAIEIPFFFLGSPSGHDFEFHLYTWLEVLAHWKQGIFYPSWAALAQFGYGEPRFIFYPPASWMLGGSLAAGLPWTIVSSVYIWLVLAAAGASMFTLARRWMNRRDAIFAAALYAANPYHLVIVYWRSAFAELLASCLLPLLALLVWRAAEEGWRWTVPLGVVLAAGWLTNAPAALMVHYSLVLLLLIVAWQRRSWRVLVTGAFAVALGLLLSAVYLLPVIYEQKWINIAEAVSPGSSPHDNFLFIHTTDTVHDAFNRLVSWVAVAEIVAILGAAWAARRWARSGAFAGANGKTQSSKTGLWYALTAWAAICTLFMVPLSSVLWDVLPKLRFMQFPWRWLLCLSFIFTFLITVGVRRWWIRFAICLAILLVIATGWRRIQPPWWDTAADLHEMQDIMDLGAGYEGTDEYTPQGADPSAIDKEAREVTAEGPQHAAIRVLQWNAESKVFTAQMSAPARLALRLFNYPAWRVEVNGRVVRTGTREGTGQMLVPVEMGANRVRVTFIRTWDRTAGGWISIISALCVGLLTAIPKIKMNVDPQ
jgi:hypothetical protein